MKTVECRHCKQATEPEEIGPTAIRCTDCGNPYDYFATSAYFNAKKKKRLEEERAKANKAVTRSYRLK